MARVNTGSGWTTLTLAGNLTLNVNTTARTASFTAVANEYAHYDTTSGPITHTMPAAPPNGTLSGGRIVTFGTGNFVTYTASAGDVMNRPSGPGSAANTLQLNNTGALWEYQSPVWSLVATGLTVAVLDTRYTPTANMTTLAAGPDLFFNPAVSGTQIVQVLQQSHDLWTPTWFRATADDPAPVNNSAALKDAPGIGLAVQANSAYQFDVAAIMDSNPTAKLRFNFTYPTGATGEWVGYGMNSGYTGSGAAAPCVNPNYYVPLGGSDQQFGCMNAGTPSYTNIHGQIVVGSTAGTLQFRYAQWVATAVNTTMKAGSSICLRKVA